MAKKKTEPKKTIKPKKKLNKVEEKHPGGRKTKLTKKLQKEVCGYIENGSSFKDACLLVNIDYSTFFTWRKDGNADIKNGESTPKAEFSKAVKKAEATFKIYHVQKITQASQQTNHWQASAWLLERKYPDEYGRKYQAKIDAKVTGNVGITMAEIHAAAEEMEGEEE